MMKMVRTETPDCLSKIDTHKDNPLKFSKWKYWGFKWATDTNKEFTWHDTRKTLTEKLQKCTKQHCSFCDAYPMRSMVKDTIEHFRPKADYPLLAYYWHNLFVACDICQEIPAKWDKADLKLVLKPDAADYEFHRYFDFDTQTGEICVNRYGTTEEQKRAKTTIFYYKLNDYDRPTARLKASYSYRDEVDIDDRVYRFIFL